MAMTLTLRCDLLEKSYLCGINNNVLKDGIFQSVL